MTVSPAPAALSAKASFTLPDSRLDHDPAIYMTWDPERQRPTEVVDVPMRDLRPDLDKAESVMTQLDARGFAVARHESMLLGEIPSMEGTKMYLDECAELLRKELGCTRVVAWNSVCRKNDPTVKLKDVPRQQAPEEGRVPTERTQPVASVAHVDQDETWGAELVDKANDAKPYKRAQIVNLWRPLVGPVRNAPLAMLDFRSIEHRDISKHASMFGIGMDLHYAAQQRWGYIRHQMPDEVVWLKCFDSAQGRDGSALYCGHVAVDVGDQDGDEGVPRESIEVRLVALWE